MERKRRPDTSDYVNTYVVPSNDTEAALCKAMALALKLKRIGIKDDFYLLGGDFFALMQVVLYSGSLYDESTMKEFGELFIFLIHCHWGECGF